jgi:hypothetical protein
MKLSWRHTGLKWYWTELVLDWTATGLNWYWTELVLDRTGTGMNGYWTEVVLQWTGTGLNWYWTELVLYWTGTGLNWYWNERVLDWTGYGLNSYWLNWFRIGISKQMHIWSAGYCVKFRYLKNLSLDKQMHEIATGNTLRCIIRSVIVTYSNGRGNKTWRLSDSGFD